MRNKEQIQADFECERDTLVGIWKANKKSRCVTQKDMDGYVDAQTLSANANKEYGISLRSVSMHALRIYQSLENGRDGKGNLIHPEKEEFKQKVFELIIKGVKENHHPITHKPFKHKFTITAEVVREIIYYLRYGEMPEYRTSEVEISPKHFSTLESIFRKAYLNATPEEKEFIEYTANRLRCDS